MLEVYSVIIEAIQYSGLGGELQQQGLEVVQHVPGEGHQKTLQHQFQIASNRGRQTNKNEYNKQLSNLNLKNIINNTFDTINKQDKVF